MMKPRRRLHALIALAILTGAGACSDDSFLTIPNRYPVISSVVTSSQILGPSDSTLVTCEATDPDGDALVYDWVTDARLRIKDSPFVVYRFNSPHKSQVFYVKTPRALVDTAWIQCTVRDRKGGADGRLIYLIVHSDTLRALIASEPAGF